MRVLLVNHRFHPAVGGTERWTLSLGRALHRRGVDVSVLSQEEPGSPASEEVDGLHVHRIPMRHVGKFRVPRGYWRTLQHLDVDVLHMSGNRIWCADFYLPLAPIRDGAQVVTPHGFYQWEMEPSPLNRLYFERLYPRALRPYDLYLASTDRERDQITSFGFRSDRVRLLRDGVERSEFERPAAPLGLRARGKFTRPRIALYVGGFWENKRVDRLVRGLAPLRDQVGLAAVGRDVPGNPFDRAHVEELARSLGVELRCLGPLGQEELLGAFREADVYLQGSQYEGFGITLLEAQACGLPWVAFEAGAASRIAQDGGGSVVRSEAELTAAVRELIEVPGVRDQRVRAAEASARRWDWDSVVEDYLQVYREALGDREGGSTRGSAARPAA